MSRHPNHLHARAALWSLRAIWPKLEAAQNAAEAAEWEAGDLGTIQAWRPGSGVHTASSGDALLDAVIRHNSPGANPYAERLARSTETVRWIAQLAGLPTELTVQDVLYVLTATPMTPKVSAHLTGWIQEQDVAIRRLLREPDDHQLLPGIPCPHCDLVGVLAIRTSAPAYLQVIICTDGCTCNGPGCDCRMTVQDASVRHVWTKVELQEALKFSSTKTASAGGPQPRSPATSATASHPPTSGTGPAATGCDESASSTAPAAPKSDIPSPTPPESTPRNDTPNADEPGRLDARQVN